MKKFIIAALLLVPMSSYAYGGIPDPFEASNTAQDAYQWSQQAIGESAAAKGLAQKDSLAEQVLQTNVNTDFTNAKDYTNQAVNGVLGEANSNADVSIKAADTEQDTETAAIAQSDANGALSSALSSSAKGDASTLNTANINAQGYANAAQSNSESFSTTGDKTTLASANQTSANGDATTLASANKTAANGDASTLASANADSQIMANAAQSNSESFSTTGDKSTLAQANSASVTGDATTLTTANQFSTSGDKTTLASANQTSANGDKTTLSSANINAQGYANRAQNNAETFAQGAANQAQINSEQYAASGIAAALAMPPAPFLPVGHAYIGVQEGTYDGQFATGIRGTYQITSSLDANVGVSGGSGLYGHVAVTAGMGYEFGG